MGPVRTDGPEVMGEILVVQHVEEEIREHDIDIETPVLDSVQVNALPYVLAVLFDGALANVRFRRPAAGYRQGLVRPEKAHVFQVEIGIGVFFDVAGKRTAMDKTDVVGFLEGIDKDLVIDVDLRFPLGRYFKPVPVVITDLFTEIAQPLFERLGGLFGQVHEYLPFPRIGMNFHHGDIVPGQAVEFSLVGNLQTLALQVKRPAVEGAHHRADTPLAGPFVRVEQLVAPVGTDIMETPDGAVGAARHYNRSAEHVNILDNVTARFRHLPFTRNIDPAFPEDPVPLGLVGFL